MANLLATVRSIGEQAVRYVVNPGTSGYAPNPATAYHGTPPIIQNPWSLSDPFQAAFRKIRDDFVANLRGVARDTAKAVAGGAVDAATQTDTFRRKQRYAIAGVATVGIVALAGLVVAIRRGGGS